MPAMKHILQIFLSQGPKEEGRGKHPALVCPIMTFIKISTHDRHGVGKENGKSIILGLRSLKSSR